MAIDYGYISSVLAEFEGKARRNGYIPRNNQGVIFGVSGVTIATGVDLGQQTCEGLREMGVPVSIIGCLVPYLGLKKEAAAEVLNRLPLSLSEDAVSEIDRAVTSAYIHKTEQNFNRDGRCAVPFSKRAKEVQAVTVSLSYQFGIKGFPSTLGAIVSGRYKDAVNELRDPSCWNNNYMTRRRREADILERVLDAK